MAGGLRLGCRLLTPAALLATTGCELPMLEAGYRAMCTRVCGGVPGWHVAYAQCTQQLSMSQVPQAGTQSDLVVRVMF